ncbi:MAG: YqgE/AlgH family protein [Deltaproteobacteria bacterium]|nr:YqgE/AlgH family protein [Deltaproteobacteria bacterium]MBW2253852.1 YqgE/AlgH family protein [Deltaproteobacteria bacterium]
MSPDSIGPTLLIASPQMHDAFFEHTLVLLWHHDDEGAIGVVVNRPIEHPLSDVLVLGEGMPDVPSDDKSQVLWGGPVEGDAGTVITMGKVHDDEGWQLACGISVTRSQDALGRLLGEGAPLILCLGYAGWGPGQLDREIEAGGWLYTDIDPQLVFEVPAETRWVTALATLGLTPTTVWMQPISE